MNQEILRKIEPPTPEEQGFLSGEGLAPEDYFSGTDFAVDSKKMLSKGMLIASRTHTRFIDFPRHRHNYIEMMYMCQGSVTHLIEGRELVLRQGEFLLLNQHLYHSIRRAERRDIGVNFIVLPEFFDAVLDMLDGGNVLTDFLVDTLRGESGKIRFLHCKVADVPEIQNLIENLLYSLVWRKRDEEKLNQTTMMLLFMHLMNHPDRIDVGKRYEYENSIMMTVLRYVDMHYKDADLTALSQSLNHSLSSLSRVIRRNTGCTFKELLQKKRFLVARGMLRKTNLSINDIAAAVGYENNSYFYRRFREKYGVSPKEYRAGEGKG